MNRKSLLLIKRFVSVLFVLLSFSTGISQISPSWLQMLPPDWQTNPFPRDTVFILKIADTTVEWYASLEELWDAVNAEVIPVNNTIGSDCNLLDTNDYLGNIKMFFDSNNYYVLFNVNDEDVQAGGWDNVGMHLAPYVDSINPGRPILPEREEYCMDERCIPGEEYVRMSYRGSWSEVGAYMSFWGLYTAERVYPDVLIYYLNESPEGDVLGDMGGGQTPFPFSSVYEPKTGGYYFLAIIPTKLFPALPDPERFQAMSVAFTVSDKDDNDIDCYPDDDFPDPQRHEAWGATTSAQAYWAIAFYGAVGIFDFGFQVVPEIVHVCPGQATGSVSLRMTSGHPPYSILWSTGDTTDTVSYLAAGSYWYTAEDALGNVISDTINIIEAGAPVAEIIDSAGTSYHGLSDGWAEVKATGGAEPYLYMWDDSLHTSGSGVANLYGKATYHVTVTDKNGCTGSDSVLIPDSDLLLMEILASKQHLCEGDTNGSAKVFAYHAEQPVEYFWGSPLNITDSVVTNLKPGVNYPVQALDAAGRMGFDSISIPPADPISLDSLFINHVNTCYGFENGSIAVIANIFAGTMVEYSIDSGRTFQSDGYFPNLPGGAHQVLIRDEDQCILQVNNIIISQPEKIQTAYITGSGDVVEFDLTFYSVTGRPGSVFDWMVEGGNIVSGQGTNSIYVHWGSGLTGNVSVVETNATGCTGDRVSLEVSIRGVGIQDEESGCRQLIVYPNPFRESALIRFPNPGNDTYMITVTDLSGRICRIIENIITSEIVLERRDLQKGFYLLEIRGPKQLKRIIIAD